MQQRSLLSGAFCPLDGWPSDESKQLADAVDRLTAQDIKATLAKLRGAGLGKAALRRAVVVEFGADDAIFEAVAPEGYVIAGQWKTLRELDARFK